MTTPTPQRERHVFRSRTAAGSPTAARTRPWGVVTKLQVSGWRFLIRRIANGVAVHDTRMLDDPLHRQSRAYSTGALFGVVFLCGGAFILHLMRPAGVTGANPILAERSTNALYVVVNDEAHPVLNLASARLIAGKPDDPTTVKASEIDKFKLGSTVGIPGAPERMVQNPAKDARWIVCDATRGKDLGTTVIAGDAVPGAGHAAPLPDNSAVLATSDGGATTFVIWGGKRSQIDLTNVAVATAVGINADTPPPRAMDRQLLNLIPEGAPLVVPFIANAGDPIRFVWQGKNPAPVIGSVVVDHQNGKESYFAVEAEGLQPISPVISAILRANNSYGLVDPVEMTPDQVAKTPIARQIPVDNYPTQALSILDPVNQPVTCGQWVKLAGAPTSSLTLLTGQSLPVSADSQPVDLVSPGPTTATRVVLPKGSGFFVQVTGQQRDATSKESEFWVSDLGVRYGLEQAPNETTDPATALGRKGDPLPVPWAVLSLLSPGPALSKTDALVAH